MTMPIVEPILAFDSIGKSFFGIPVLENVTFALG